MNNLKENSYKGNILIVDDTPANLRLLVDILTENGYKARPVPNGKLALTAARNMPPDLILLDIMMPDMDGYEVCCHLKEDKLNRDVPIVFISAVNDVFDKVKAFAMGGVDFITKPFQVEEVLVRVETHLSRVFLQKDLQAKNEELLQTLQQLKATQNQLIQSEKMALLGQLIAGIGHEINTPLGVIRSSIDNVADFLNQELESLPSFLKQLSFEREQDFLALLRKANQQNFTFSSKEKRQLKKMLICQLESQYIANSEIIADTLVDIGIYDEIELFFPLFQDAQSQTILNTAYRIISLKKSTQTIGTAIDRAAKVVFALKSYARYDTFGEKVEINITDGIETALTLYQNQLKQGVEVIRNYQERLPLILCYTDELNQVWTNLIQNALQAIENRGTIKIDVRQQEGWLLIGITDSGKGIPPEIMPRIFEPFFTTKPPGEGSGLGLDIVKKIIEKHRGTIEVESVPGQTTFTVSLPIEFKE
jgi:two-component system, NtrC family, sensor kinase